MNQRRLCRHHGETGTVTVGVVLAALLGTVLLAIGASALLPLAAPPDGLDATNVPTDAATDLLRTGLLVVISVGCGFLGAMFGVLMATARLDASFRVRVADTLLTLEAKVTLGRPNRC